MFRFQILSPVVGVLTVLSLLAWSADVQACPSSFEFSTTCNGPVNGLSPGPPTRSWLDAVTPPTDPQVDGLMKVLVKIQESKQTHRAVLDEIDAQIAACEEKVGGRCPFRRWRDVPEIKDRYDSDLEQARLEGGVALDLMAAEARRMDEFDQEVLDEVERTGVPAESRLYEARNSRLRRLIHEGRMERLILEKLALLAAD